MRRARIIAAMVAAHTGCLEVAPPEPTGPDPVPPDELGPLRGEVTHVFELGELDPGADSVRCASWTLGNEAELYVSGVRSVNEGGFHHGNWFVVPDEAYAGDDGVWDCAERGFDELATFSAGSVLFAQSTQARQEAQRFSDGVVVKIPPRSRIVADVHLLNATPRPLSTRQWLTLELVHPSTVQTVLKPLLLAYYDLWIPAGDDTEHIARCGSAGGGSWPSMQLHYVLPHYHGFGVFFDLAVDRSGDVGGDPVGSVESVFRVEGFDGQSLGRAFDPPVEVPEGGGLTFTCGYRNWTNGPLAWGLGEGEMCVLLGLVDSRSGVVGGVLEGHDVIGVRDGVLQFGGRCSWLELPGGAASGLPTARERYAPLYLPPSPEGPPPPPLPQCTDSDVSAPPVAEPTLEALDDHVFGPSCAFTSCHGAAVAGGLDLRPGEGLHAALLEHVMARPTDLPLISPGDPDGSYLVQVLSRCEPGEGLGPMPANSPVLLENEVVALVRAWIEAGAPGADF